MNPLEIVDKAISELKLQKRLIKRQYGIYDPTLYRAWVEAVIPTLLPVLEKTRDSLYNGEPEANLAEEILLASKIIGHQMTVENRKIKTSMDYRKAKNLT